MLLIFWTNGSRQTVQTQIRLLLEEQSDQGLLFHLHHFDKIPLRFGLFNFLNFRYITAKISGIPKFSNFTVMFFNVRL